VKVYVYRFCQFFSGKVHGSLARAGKVKGQTPKVFYPNIFRYQIDLLGIYASWFADILKLMYTGIFGIPNFLISVLQNCHEQCFHFSKLIVHPNFH
jgi:hypothetical protein